jgi:hypothetical protein
MSGIEILPALIYGGMAAGEGTAAGAAAAGLGAGALGAGAAAGLGAGAGAATSAGLTASEMAALEAAAAQGLAGGGELSALGSGQSVAGLLGDLGATEVAAPLDYGPELDSTAKFDQWESMKTKGINALNKVGGTLNKLPKPVQGMLMSSLLAPPKQPAPPPMGTPPRQSTQAPPMQLAYQGAPPQTPGFAGGMGGMSGAGLLGQNLSPQELEMLRRMRMQQRGGM